MASETKTMWSVKKDYLNSNFNPGELFVKEGNKYRYFYPMDTNRRRKGVKYLVKTQNGKLLSYKKK